MLSGTVHSTEVVIPPSGAENGALLPAAQWIAPYLPEGMALQTHADALPVPYDEHLSEIGLGVPGRASAIGLLGAQLRISGELAGDEIGNCDVMFPRQPGNILLIWRQQIMEARAELSRQFSHGMMLGDRIDPIGALLHEMYKKPLAQHGHAYVAIVALSEWLEPNGTKRLQASYAAGKTAVRKIFLPIAA